MKAIYHKLLEEYGENRFPALATIIDKKGSGPQVPGASSLFSDEGLLAGTLGGGILEGDATGKALEALGSRNSVLYEIDLDSDFPSEDGAICGGKALVLIDVAPERNIGAFRAMHDSLRRGKPGILITRIGSGKKPGIEREWYETGTYESSAKEIPGLSQLSEEDRSLVNKGVCVYTREPSGRRFFMEPLKPVPKLYIAGAGHIGKAVCHLADLLEFEVTVIDDREEYANPKNLPEADHIIVGDIGKAVAGIRDKKGQYLLIVTRGHRDDTEALKAAINSDLAYIGLIGSRKKIRTMRENFIANGWATAARFERVHAPVGIEIGSKTVQEIAVSICAQLVQVRNRSGANGNTGIITGIILAAGESKRMGKPKMLLPFGNSSILETVIANARVTQLHNVRIVLGSGREEIEKKIHDPGMQIVFNPDYKKGMLSSVQCGLREIGPDSSAVMILLGDQPMIGKAVIEKMIEAYRTAEKTILVATFNGKRGHPLLFRASYIPEILAFPSGSSLKSLLTKHNGQVQEIETGEPGILRDIDTEKEYQEELKYQKNND